MFFPSENIINYPAANNSLHKKIDFQYRTTGHFDTLRNIYCINTHFFSSQLFAKIQI